MNIPCSTQLAHRRGALAAASLAKLSLRLEARESLSTETAYGLECEFAKLVMTDLFASKQVINEGRHALTRPLRVSALSDSVADIGGG